MALDSNYQAHLDRLALINAIPQAKEKYEQNQGYVSDSDLHQMASTRLKDLEARLKLQESQNAAFKAKAIEKDERIRSLQAEAVRFRNLVTKTRKRVDDEPFDEESLVWPKARAKERTASPVRPAEPVTLPRRVDDFPNEETRGQRRAKQAAEGSVGKDEKRAQRSKENDAWFKESTGDFDREAWAAQLQEYMKDLDRQGQ